MKRPGKYAIFSIFWVGTAILASCEPGISTTPNLGSTPCQPNTAVIVVTDSGITRGCGCNEAEGAVALNTAMTCTVHANQTYITVFYESSLQHNIISQGSPTFPNGTPSVADSTQTSPFWIYPLPAGTYQFVDQMNPQIFGKFVFN